MQKSLGQAKRQRERLRLPPWQLRIGIKTGALVAGVVGTRRFTYDVFGHAVNAARRLEEACEPARVNISGSTLHHVEGLFETEARGRVEVKHMGALEMYFLDRIRPEYSADADGSVPNERFWKATGVG